MGNRAIVRFDQGERAVAGIYLHWHGSDVIDWLREAAPNMRAGDASYAAARFCAFCAEKMPGGLSLGILGPDECTEDSAEWQDNGMFIVNCQTGRVQHVRGPNMNGRAYRIKMGEF